MFSDRISQTVLRTSCGSMQAKNQMHYWKGEGKIDLHLQNTCHVVGPVFGISQAVGMMVKDKSL